MWRYATRLAPATRGFSTSALRLANTPFYDEFANVLKNDLKKSMLQKDNARKETVKMLRSELKNYQIDSKGDENNEFAIFKVINKMIKTRASAAAEYAELKRQDLVDKEQSQVRYLQEYLSQVPVATEEKIDELVTALLNKIKAELKEGEALPAAAAILKQLDLNALEKEWKASTKDIRKSLFTVYKKLFG